jgi:hypothetical protein
MALQISKSAIMSKTIQFLTAGGLTLAIAVWHEVAKPVTDWVQVATMLAGIVVGIGGGAYGRIMAQGPVTSVVAAPGDK